MLSGKKFSNFFYIVGGDLGDLLDAILVPQEVLNFGIKDLPGRLVRLLENSPAILRIGVVAKVSAFV